MQSRVTGWWVFAAILLGVSGILNVIWGAAPFWSICVFALSIIVIYELAKAPEGEFAG